MSESPLVRHQLVHLLPRQDDTLLNYPLKLNDTIENILIGAGEAQ